MLAGRWQPYILPDLLIGDRNLAKTEDLSIDAVLILLLLDSKQKKRAVRGGHFSPSIEEE